MGEKQFYSSDDVDGYFIYDKRCNVLPRKEVVDLLNNQQDKIEYLESVVKNQDDKIKILQLEIESTYQILKMQANKLKGWI